MVRGPEPRRARRSAGGTETGVSTQSETVALWVFERLARAAGYDCSDPALRACLQMLSVAGLADDVQGIVDVPETGCRDLVLAAGLVAFHLSEAGFEPG